MLQNVEVICKQLLGWRMLKQFSVCQTPEIETDELFLWASTTAPAEKADPFCQGSLVKTVDCKSEFSFWAHGTQKIQPKCSYVHLTFGIKTINLSWRSMGRRGRGGTNCLHVLNKGTFSWNARVVHTQFLTFPSWVRNVPKWNNPHFNCTDK